jgi:hypothetical protein
VRALQAPSLAEKGTGDKKSAAPVAAGVNGAMSDRF